MKLSADKISGRIRRYSKTCSMTSLRDRKGPNKVQFTNASAFLFCTILHLGQWAALHAKSTQKKTMRLVKNGGAQKWYFARILARCMGFPLRINDTATCLQKSCAYLCIRVMFSGKGGCFRSPWIQESCANI